MDIKLEAKKKVLKNIIAQMKKNLGKRARKESVVKASDGEVTKTSSTV